MSLVIRIVGALWAVYGVVTCYRASRVGTVAAATTGGVLMSSVLLFILPGLVLYALGTIMQRRKDRASVR